MNDAESIRMVAGIECINVSAWKDVLTTLLEAPSPYRTTWTLHL
jgi:hypothetical protein